MNAFTRRSFLRNMSLGAAGVVGTQALAGGPAAAAIRRVADADVDNVDAREDRVVAFVRAGDRDHVTLLVGDREVVTHDRRLARSLLRAAR
jgi:hypothetical protein